jgi:hypothetical protein
MHDLNSIVNVSGQQNNLKRQAVILFPFCLNFRLDKKVSQKTIKTTIQHRGCTKNDWEDDRRWSTGNRQNDANDRIILHSRTICKLCLYLLKETKFVESMSQTVGGHGSFQWKWILMLIKYHELFFDRNGITESLECDNARPFVGNKISTESKRKEKKRKEIIKKEKKRK